MRKTSEMVQILAEAWKLPHEVLLPEPKAKAKAMFARKSQLQTSPTPESIPPLQPHPEDQEWCRHGHRFRCVVDCQVLAGLINGTTLLTNATYRPTLRRMVSNLAIALQKRPPQDWIDPVSWRKRARNQHADRVANVTMDAAER